MKAVKQLQNFFGGIHSWSEDVRKLLAGISFVICLALVFAAWSAYMSYKLSEEPGFPDISAEEPVSQDSVAEAGDSGTAELPVKEETGRKPEEEVYTPLAGIVESFRSLERLFPAPDFKVKDFGHAVERKAYSSLSLLAGIIYK